MDVLRDDLADALAELEEGDEDEAHDIIENHMEKASKVRRALEEMQNALDDHIERLDDLSTRTESWDVASVRNTIDELRSTMDDEEEVTDAFRKLKNVFSE